MRSLHQLVAVGVVTALLVFGLSRAIGRGPKAIDLRAARATSVVRLAGHTASYFYHPTSGKIRAEAHGGSLTRELDLSLVVDGAARPITIERAARRGDERNALGFSFPIAIGEELFGALV